VSPDPKSIGSGFDGPEILKHGFGPFFLGAGVFAFAAILIWIFSFSTAWSFLEGKDLRGWHAHEMIFGFLGAIISGFVLTAMPNWTGRIPIAGYRLLVLFGFWLAGRIAMMVGADGSISVIALEGAFLILLSLVVCREVLLAKNWRNLPVALLISCFAFANLLFHFETLHWYELGPDAGYGQRLALGVAMILIALIGGRIIPNFTLNWMKKQSIEAVPVAFDGFDKAVLCLTIVGVVFWMVWPGWTVSGAMFILIGCLHFIRLMRWRGWMTFSEPLVLILHVGYGWLVMAFLFIGIGIVYPALVAQSDALHALTIGAIGMMTMAVMTRATLGHTGRQLKANALTKLLYGFLFVSAVVRLCASMMPWSYYYSLVLAGVCWVIAYGLFVLVYGPMMLSHKKNK